MKIRLCHIDLRHCQLEALGVLVAMIFAHTSLAWFIHGSSSAFATVKVF